MSEALTHPAIAVTIGVIASAIMVILARRLAPGREMLVYGIGLGITAIAYVVFALALGAPREHLERELVGAVVFGIASVLGTRRWPALLALGYVVHVLWDLCFHYAGGPSFAPSWYAMFCVGFDLSIGGYIAGRIT